MERRSVIAIAAASTGAVIAASVAAVAAINASVASSVEPTNGGQVLAVATPEAGNYLALEPTAPISLPSASDSQLPEIIVPVVDVATDTRSMADPAPVTKPKSESVTAATQESAIAPPAATTPAPAASVAAQPRISAAQATSLVVAATGGTARSTQATTHAGFEAFAVQVQRPDGSIVTGFVEATSGVIYEWVVDQAAPAPVAPTATYDDDHDEDDDREDDDHDDDHDDDDHDDDHEGDDDDD